MTTVALTNWETFGFTLCGILIGAFVAHYLTKDRDAEARKAILDREADIRRRVFRRHLLLWRYRLERTHPADHAGIWAKYSEMAPEILAEAALVAGDFTPSLEFRTLVERAGHWRPEDAEAEARSKAKDQRDVLRDSICDVYSFTLQDGKETPTQK